MRVWCRFALSLCAVSICGTVARPFRPTQPHHKHLKRSMHQHVAVDKRETDWVQLFSKLFKKLIEEATSAHGRSSGQMESTLLSSAMGTSATATLDGSSSDAISSALALETSFTDQTSITLSGQSTTSIPSDISSTISESSGISGKSTQASSTTTSATSQASDSAFQCPDGTTYAEMTDPMTSFDETIWTLELGNDNQTTYGDDGMKMTISEDQVNVVYQSLQQWKAPTTMSFSTMTTAGAGTVGSVIFKNSNESDEIDLELVQNSYQIPLWKDGLRLTIGRDTQVTDAADTTKLADWEYEDSALQPGAYHDWTVAWTSEDVTWSTGSRQLVKFTKLSDAQLWPDEALHVRFGMWAPTPVGTWAGTPDWTGNPNPYQMMKSISIKGCAVSS